MKRNIEFEAIMKMSDKDFNQWMKSHSPLEIARLQAYTEKRIEEMDADIKIIKKATKTLRR